MSDISEGKRPGSNRDVITLLDDGSHLPPDDCGNSISSNEFQVDVLINTIIKHSDRTNLGESWIKKSAHSGN